MLLSRNILREGHPKLTKMSTNVQIPLNARVQKALHEMDEYLLNSQDPELSVKYKLRAGAAIAAPQIGINERFFVMDIEDFDLVKYAFGVVNPVIIEQSESQIYLSGGEGCLSVDKPTWGITPRAEWIVWQGLFYDLVSRTLTPVKMRLDGYAAIVFQHEFDHLNGVLFTSKEFLSLNEAKNVLDLDKYAAYTKVTEHPKVYGDE
jgi:peptide deformylase